MKSDPLGPAAHTASVVKAKPNNNASVQSKNDKVKPTHTPAKSKIASAIKPVLNGTAGSGTQRENSSALGSCGRAVLDRKPNPGARPKSSPAESDFVASQTKAAKVQNTTMSGKDLPQESVSDSMSNAQPAQNTPSSSGSTSPDNSMGSPHNNGYSTTTGLRLKPQAKAATKSPLTKPAQKPETYKTSSPTNKANKAKPTTTNQAGPEISAARSDPKNRSAENHALSRHSSAISSRKSVSPKKEIEKDASKPSISKKTTKASIKTSLCTSKQSPPALNKTGSKQKTPHIPATKSSLKSSGAVKNSATSAGSKKPMAAAKDLTFSPKHTNSKKVNRQLNTASAEVKTRGQGVVESSVGSSTVPISLKQHSLVSPDVLDQPEVVQEPIPRGASVTSTKIHVVKSSNPLRKLGSTEVKTQPVTRETQNYVNSVNTSKQCSRNKLTSAYSNSPHLSGPCQGHNSMNSSKESDLSPDTPCSLGGVETTLEDSWNGLHPDSETGSATTSSDDIKPRSEDYDAGGSQDDDCNSQEHGISKCGTMRCPDFLGRSSSDTSTPEELKMYESGSGLHVEVRLRGRDAETTSEEETGSQRPQSWIRKDEVPVEEKLCEMDTTITNIKAVQDHQLFSSGEEEETEDERSEVEVLPRVMAPPYSEPSPQFQGIVNLAFEDAVDQENKQPEYHSVPNFHRSVLLSVDECEELGCEEGGALTPPHQSGDAHGDVFDDEPQNTQNDNSSQLSTSTVKSCYTSNHQEKEPKSAVFLTELCESPLEDSSCNQSNVTVLDRNPSDLPAQEHSSHLDLRQAQQYDSLQVKHIYSKKADLRLDLPESQSAATHSPGHTLQQDSTTSITMTSFCPEDAASPQDECTIVRLETHH